MVREDHFASEDIAHNMGLLETAWQDLLDGAELKGRRLGEAQELYEVNQGKHCSGLGDTAADVVLTASSAPRTKLMLIAQS
jgi:hypothetical protein